MLQRLFQFVKSQGMSVRAFEQKIHASDGMIRRAINNGTDIQSHWISLTAENFPQLNIEWLITGEGEMLRNSDNGSVRIDHSFAGRDIIGKIGSRVENAKRNGKKEESLQEQLNAKKKIIASLQQQLNGQKQLLEAKDEIIAMLKNVKN